MLYYSYCVLVVYFKHYAAVCQFLQTNANRIELRTAPVRDFFLHFIIRRGSIQLPMQAKGNIVTGQLAQVVSINSHTLFCMRSLMFVVLNGCGVIDHIDCQQICRSRATNAESRTRSAISMNSFVQFVCTHCKHLHKAQHMVFTSALHAQRQLDNIAWT